MEDSRVSAWPRPAFLPSDQPTEIFFVAFGKAPLRELPLSRSLFGLPDVQLVEKLDVREHQRALSREWFENWWGGAFGKIAQQDLGEQLPLLTESDLCHTLSFDLPDQPDLSPQQTIWGLVRWLCARGVHVVLDVHAMRFRTRAEVEALSFAGADLERDVKLVFETDPTQGPLHLMHTRGLCKFARPELMGYIEPGDVDAMARLLNQGAEALMNGAAPQQLRFGHIDGVALQTAPSTDQPLVDSLGLRRAVLLGRADGAALTGLSRLVPAT
jgi:hypothetical protein